MVVCRAYWHVAWSLSLQNPVEAEVWTSVVAVVEGMKVVAAAAAD
jgi:hypothetical protein